MDDCIFCKIVNGKSPSYKVYEDEKFIGILDIFPRAKGHVLLLPKKHFQWVYDLPDFGKYWEVALKITKAMEKGLKTTFIHYLTFGFHVSHAHIHIIPHYKPIEQESHFGEALKFSKEEFEEISKIISSAF